jgi:hypothetical protein
MRARLDSIEARWASSTCHSLECFPSPEFQILQILPKPAKVPEPAPILSARHTGAYPQRGRLRPQPSSGTTATNTRSHSKKADLKLLYPCLFTAHICLQSRLASSPSLEGATNLILRPIFNLGYCTCTNTTRNIVNMLFIKVLG